MPNFLLFALFFTSLGIAYASDSLQTQLRTAKYDTTRLRLYSELASDYRNKSNLDSLLIYTQLGLKLAQKLNNTYYSSDLYRHQAFYHRFKKQYEPAIKMALIAIEVGKKNKQLVKVESAGYLLAIIYCDKSFNTGSQQAKIKAIRQLFDNISFSNQHQTFVHIEKSYSLLSLIYKDNGNDSLAYLYLEKRLQYATDLKQGRDQLFNLSTKFYLSLYKKQTEEAKKYLANMLNFNMEKKEDPFYLYILSEATKTSIKFQQFDLVYSIIQKAQSKTDIMDDERKIIFNIEKATIFLHLKKYKLAQQANQQAIFLSKKIKLAFGDQLSILINQQKLFEHQKRFEEALSLNKRINSMQDSLTSTQYSFELAASEERLEHENKERFFQQQLKIQQLENLSKTERLKSAKQLQWIFTVLILLLLVVVAIITLQMRKITQQSTTLKKLNEAQNQLFAIIGHDLRSPILALQGNLERLSQSSTEIQKQLPRINNLLLTTDNLLYWAESQQNSAKYQPQAVALSEIIAEVLALLDASIENAQLRVQNQVPDTTVVKVDENHLRIIIRNVVQNAIKFTPAGGSITFSTQQLAQSIQLTIEDTGIGFEQSQKTTSKRSTQLGLRLVRNLLALNGGAFSIQKHAQQGTVVSITLPISPNMA